MSIEKQPKKDWSRVDAILKKQREEQEALAHKKTVTEASPERQQIFQQEYERTKREIAKSRKEMGITKAPDELEKEDIELRKKFGLE